MKVVRRSYDNIDGRDAFAVEAIKHKFSLHVSFSVWDIKTYKITFSKLAYFTKLAKNFRLLRLIIKHSHPKAYRSQNYSHEGTT